MLVGLGHEPVRAVAVLVVFNSLVSYLGSVGMVVWFGFKNLGEYEAPSNVASSL